MSPVLLDSDTLSELSRGHAKVTERARAYLRSNGRLTFSAVTLYERLRGYRAAMRQGKPFEPHLRQFELFAESCIVLPVDDAVADRAATIWASLSARARGAYGDILIAATAAAHGLPLVTRNRRDFAPISAIEGIDLPLLDWTK
ncbi:MAG: PIN domain-containing protein [Polyangiaceae bacterium]